MTHDVLISGLGPSGAVLAGLLAQRGVRVAVFDKLDDLFPLPRAVGLDHEAMRIVQELGIADQVSQFIDHYRPSEYLGMDGQLIKRLDTQPPPYPLGWAPNYVFNQPKFEHAVRARLDALPNVDVYKSSEVVSIEQGDDQVEVTVRHMKEGSTQRYSARYMVACDGGSSPARKSLGLELEDLGFDEPWLVVDALVPPHVSDRLPQTQVQYCEAQRPCTFVYCTGNHRRWEIMLSDKEYRTGDFPDEMLWPILGRWVKPGEVQLWRRAAYRFHGLIAKQWRKNRVFLAGDAAHMTPPFMAQGMVQGLRDAHNLAWKLAYVLQGKAAEFLLDTYEVERKPHVRTTTLKAMELGRVICERDPGKARIRDQKLRDDQDGSIKTAYRQQMIPGLTTGMLQAADSSAGQIFPQPFVEKAGQKVLLDGLVSGDWTLYFQAQMWGPGLENLKRQTEGLPIQFVRVADLDDSEFSQGLAINSPMIVQWMNEHSVSIVLVRPDKYVYGAADSIESAERMMDSLRAIMT